MLKLGRAENPATKIFLSHNWKKTSNWGSIEKQQQKLQHLALEPFRMTISSKSVKQTQSPSPRLYDSLRPMASLITDAHSSLSTALCRHLLTFISHIFFSTSSRHLNHHHYHYHHHHHLLLLLLLLLLLPCSLLSNIFMM